MTSAFFMKSSPGFNVVVLQESRQKVTDIPSQKVGAWGWVQSDGLEQNIGAGSCSRMESGQDKNIEI